MNKIQINYQKVYTDDTGKHMIDVFGDDEIVSIHVKQFWNDVVDGFYTCDNADIKISAISGNCRIVVESINKEKRFEEYYLTGMDGKIVTIPSGYRYAIQNLDERKSDIIMGSTMSNPDFSYYGNVKFNWKKRRG